MGPVYEALPALEHFQGVFMHLVAFALISDTPDTFLDVDVSSEINVDEDQHSSEEARANEDAEEHDHVFITVGENVWTGALYQQCSCGVKRIAKLT